jgi:hypothetical protein
VKVAGRLTGGNSTPPVQAFQSKLRYSKKAGAIDLIEGIKSKGLKSSKAAWVS